MDLAKLDPDVSNYFQPSRKQAVWAVWRGPDGAAGSAKGRKRDCGQEALLL